MSGISLREFERTARLSAEGEIRIAKGEGHEHELVNKGQLGHRIATWFNEKSESAEQERTGRNQSALDAFQKTLADKYGNVIADQAWRDAVGEGEPQALTGRTVTNAIDAARSLSKDRGRLNREKMTALLPAPPPQQHPELLKQVVRQTLGADVFVLTPPELDEYQIRFQQNIAAAGPKLLTMDEVKQIAADTLEQVHKLHGAGKLEAAVDIRREFKEALKDVVRCVADKGSPDEAGAEELARRLEEAVAWFEKHRAMELGHGDLERAKELTRRALVQAFKELNDEVPELLKRAQKNALSPESMLRAIYAEIAETGDRKISPPQRKVLAMIQSLSESVVEGLARRRGGLTGSVEGDVAHLQTPPDPGAGAGGDLALQARELAKVVVLDVSTHRPRHVEMTEFSQQSDPPDPNQE